jgi:hypothetical protein
VKGAPRSSRCLLQAIEGQNPSCPAAAPTTPAPSPPRPPSPPSGKVGVTSEGGGRDFLPLSPRCGGKEGGHHVGDRRSSLAVLGLLHVLRRRRPLFSRESLPRPPMMPVSPRRPRYASCTARIPRLKIWPGSSTMYFF